MKIGSGEMGGVAAIAVFYGSILFFVIASLVKLTRYVRTPVHLRWELYTTGSVYEAPKWWAKAPQIGFKEKLGPIILDILLLRRYYRRNRGFWYFLFLFHSGLYSLVLWHIWLFASALVTEPEAAPYWGLVWGHITTALIFIGSAGILVRRLTDRDLKAYYKPVHYLKWLLILVTLVGGFYAVYFYSGNSMPAIAGYVKEQLAFDMEAKLRTPLMNTLHVLFVSPLLIYLPFGHFLRLFFRYYHELRWDHVHNLKGSGLETRIERLLGSPVSWSAPHVRSGRTWAEVATGLPENALPAR